MRYAIGILILGIGLMVLCGIILKKEQERSIQKDREIENLKAKSDAYDRHMDQCDSSGVYYMKHNNLSK